MGRVVHDAHRRGPRDPRRPAAKTKDIQDTGHPRHRASKTTHTHTTRGPGGRRRRIVYPAHPSWGHGEATREAVPGRAPNNRLHLTPGSGVWWLGTASVAPAQVKRSVRCLRHTGTSKTGHPQDERHSQDERHPRQRALPRQKTWCGSPRAGHAGARRLGGGGGGAPNKALEPTAPRTVFPMRMPSMARRLTASVRPCGREANLQDREVSGGR